VSVCLCVRLVAYGEQMHADDIATNMSLARHGADVIEKASGSGKQLKMLTHCNTGSLATAGYGTALGVCFISPLLTRGANFVFSALGQMLKADDFDHTSCLLIKSF